MKMLKGIKAKFGKRNIVTGISEINHKMRLILNLNLEEYVIIEAIEKLYKTKGSKFDSHDLYRRTGIEYCKPVLNSLARKGLIKKKNKKPVPTEKWIDAFGISEKEFMNFWKKDGKNCWPGSKKDAFKKYQATRKKYSKEHLINQRNAYFKYLDNEKYDRHKMMATVFLNISKERFNEPWKNYTKEIKDKIKKEKEKEKEKNTRLDYEVKK